MTRPKDPMVIQVASFIGEHALLSPGDRVAVAVSGGADSVALLEVLLAVGERLELRLSVAHFNHRLRGVESDEDQRFVEALAAERGLPFFVGGADVAAEAERRGQNLEACARSLRYEFLDKLVRGGEVDRVATGHTAEDQAETVIARFLRGAGTRGLAGIYPAVQSPKSKVQSRGEEVQSPKSKVQSRKAANLPGSAGILPAGPLSPAETLQQSGQGSRATLDFGLWSLDSHAWLIRPLLEIRRARLRAWLLKRCAAPGARFENSRGPAPPRTSHLAPRTSHLAPRTLLFREDSSNADPRFTRNRIRAGLLPALEAYNPRLVEQLVRAAQIARDEEDFWGAHAAALLSRITTISEVSGARVLKLRVADFVKLTKAEQRRAIRAACDTAGFTGQLDAANVEAIRALAARRQSGRKFRAGGLEIERVFGEIDFHQCPAVSDNSRCAFEFRVPVPGSCRLPSGGRLLFKLVNRRFSDWGYNITEESVVDARLIGDAVTVRNWKPGDLFDSPTGQGTRKIKSLLLQRRVPVQERKVWPVVVCGGRVVWMRGFPVARDYRLRTDADSGLWIQECGGEDSGEL